MPIRLTLLILLAGVAVALVACDSKAAPPAAAPSATATATGTPSASSTAQPSAAQASATPTPPAPRVTEVIRYVPSRPDASTTQDGSCFARSAALSWREDTYRCSVGNAISDPCFALPDSVLVCGANPTRTDAKPFLLRVTAPLPAQPPNAAQIEAGKKNGWLVKLPDGTTCGFLTGATAGFDGKRINYGCTDGTSILGDLNPGATWTARFVTGSVGPSGFTPKTDEVKSLAVVYQ